MRSTQGRATVAALVLGLAGVSGSVETARMQPEAAGMRIVINIAARRLHVYENGERTRTYTVAVGQRGHRTPTGRYAISRVVWNPWWHPPNRGWARRKRVTPPGPNNPMGRVKMYFRNLYYIHGTPHRGSLGRAVSHGCVRMSNGDAIELARLVHRYGGGASTSTIERLVASPRMTRTIWLKRRIPVQIVSRMAAVEGGRLELYAWEAWYPEEVVRREALEALRAAGFDVRELDAGRFGALVAASRRGPVSARLADLVASVPAGGGARNG